MRKNDISIDPTDLEQVDVEGRRLFADDGTDLTLLREFARLSPTERLRQLQSMTNFIERIRSKSDD